MLDWVGLARQTRPLFLGAGSNIWFAKRTKVGLFKKKKHYPLAYTGGFIKSNFVVSSIEEKQVSSLRHKSLISLFVFPFFTSPTIPLCMEEDKNYGRKKRAPPEEIESEEQKRARSESEESAPHPGDDDPQSFAPGSRARNARKYRKSRSSSIISKPSSSRMG